MKRTIKVNPESNSGLEVTDESVKLSGDTNNFFYADESGIYGVGKLSILTEPQNIRIGAMFRLPTAYEMMIPSTVTTPRPMLIPDPPIEGLASLASVVTDFLGELL